MFVTTDELPRHGRCRTPRPMHSGDPNYQHPGWLGPPYFSDFQAKWGLIRLDEILDCTHISRLRDAALEADRQGYRYFISKYPSRYGSWLYINDGRGRYVCIYGKLWHQEYQARHGREKYADLVIRIRQTLRVARGRAAKRGLAFDLDAEDIIHRVQHGTCEATGLPLCLEVNGKGGFYNRNPYTPSLDRIDSSLGYTRDNVMVVCLGWNLLKSNFDLDLLTGFIDGWVANRQRICETISV